MNKLILTMLLLATQIVPSYAIERNVASQKLTVMAFDSATGRPKTGDAANITAYLSKDSGTLTALTDTSASEISSTNAPGKYLFDLSRTETNAIKLDFGAKSSTSGIDVYAVPSTAYTTSRTNVAIPPAVPTSSGIFYYNFESTYEDASGANDLTANNSPAFVPGLVGTCIDLEASLQQSLECADNANLSTGDIDFSGDCWVMLESKVSNGYIACKATGATLEFAADYLQSSDRFRFFIRSGGGTFVTVEANSLGSPTVGVWYHVFYAHDAAGNLVSICIDNGTTDSVATSGNAPPDNASPLRFGWSGSGTTYFDGKIDEPGFWKRVLTTQERTDRYNAGRGNTLQSNAIFVTRPRSPEIIQRKSLTHGDVEIEGTYLTSDLDPTAIEARYVFTNPASTGAWTVIDANPADGKYKGTLKDVPKGSGSIETRWANSTGVSRTVASVGVGRIFATAGQSNMQGLANNLQALTNSGSQLCLMWREGETAAKPLADSTNGEAAYGTPIPQMVTTLLAADPNCPIEVITGADGGATIMVDGRHWNPVDGASYLDLLNSVTLADPNAIEGVLWLQGEGEAYYDVPTKDYEAAQLTVLEALHAFPGNPWVMVSQIGMLPASEVGGALAIRQAQRNAWDSLPYVRRGIVWHDINLSVDQLHARLDAEVEEQGTRFGEAIIGDVPPVITGITTTGGSGTISVRYDRTLTTDASLAAAAFAVPNHTVTAAAASGEIVTLTVTPVVEAWESVSVTVGAGNTGVGVDVPTSAGGMPAAAETYYQANGYLDAALAAVKSKSDYLPSERAGEADGLLIAGENAATTFFTLTSTGAFTVNGSTLATSTALATVDGIIDNIFTGMELDGSVYRWTTNALEQAPSGGGGGFAMSDLVADDDDTAGTWGYLLSRAITTDDELTFSEEAIAAVTDAAQSSYQNRANFEPAPGFATAISRRADGTYKATKPIRLTAGAVTNVFVFVDMSPLFGRTDFVETVGTPVVSGGSVTASATGPRDTYAVVELDGVATAGEARTVTVPVTMTSGTTLNVVFDLEVLE